VSDLNQVDRILTEVLEEAWSTFWKDALIYIVAAALAVFIVLCSLGLLSGVMAVGFCDLVRRLRRGERAGVLTIFSGFSRAVPATVATLVMVVGVAVGLVLLVLPGLFLICAWSLTFYAMEAEDLGAGAALARSYELFKENALFICVLVLVLAIVNSIAGAFVLTALFAVPLTSVAMLLAYEKVARLAPRRHTGGADELIPHSVS
jgi:hypothetical protein